jgi:hypothetical protein
MKCDVCENEASVFLTQIINGQMTTVNLCEGCSKAKGVTEETGFGLAEAFLSPTQRSEDSMEVVCNACGFTASQLKKIGRMGCPECYHSFREGPGRPAAEHAQRHAPCRQAAVERWRHRATTSAASARFCGARGTARTASCGSHACSRASAAFGGLPITRRSRSGRQRRAL